MGYGNILESMAIIRHSNGRQHCNGLIALGDRNFISLTNRLKHIAMDQLLELKTPFVGGQNVTKQNQVRRNDQQLSKN